MDQIILDRDDNVIRVITRIRVMSAGADDGVVGDVARCAGRQNCDRDVRRTAYGQGRPRAGDRAAAFAAAPAIARGALVGHARRQGICYHHMILVG